MSFTGCRFPGKPVGVNLPAGSAPAAAAPAAEVCSPHPKPPHLFFCLYQFCLIGQAMGPLLFCSI